MWHKVNGLDPIYLSNHAVLATGDSRPRNVWPNRITLPDTVEYQLPLTNSGSDAVERACPGRSGSDIPITGDETPCKLRYEP